MSELSDLSAAIVGGPELSSYMISKETSSYAIKINGYSSIKERVKYGDYVKSVPFTVGGYSWVVWYYPHGSLRTEKHDNSISVYLALDSAMAKDVKAKVKFSLLDKDGEAVEPQSETDEHIFTSRDSTWGFSDFLKKVDLESSLHLRGDSFSISCDITVVKRINTFVVVPPSNLQQHLGDLLKSMDGADVTFHVDGESFSAHRSVLAARSPVFRAALFGAMKERDGSPVEISDMESDVFRSLLHFIYTDSLSVSEMTQEGDAQIDGEMARHLLVAADRYNIERLKLICEKRMCDLIDSDTVATSLALADQHSFYGIKKACFEFLASPSNLKAMMASDGYEHLKSSCPSVLKELVASFLPAELKAAKDIIMTI